MNVTCTKCKKTYTRTKTSLIKAASQKGYDSLESYIKDYVCRSCSKGTELAKRKKKEPVLKSMDDLPSMDSLENKEKPAEEEEIDFEQSFEDMEEIEELKDEIEEVESMLEDILDEFEDEKEIL